MENKQKEIMKSLVEFLDASRFKVYKESIKFFDNYALINYQSISIVDFNIPDDNMIYGIGTLIYRMRDNKIFEIHSHSDKTEQIIKILGSSK